MWTNFSLRNSTTLQDFSTIEEKQITMSTFLLLENEQNPTWNQILKKHSLFFTVPRRLPAVTMPGRLRSPTWVSQHHVWCSHPQTTCNIWTKLRLCFYNSLSDYDSVSTLIEVWFHFSEYPKSICTSSMFLIFSYQTNMTSPQGLINQVQWALHWGQL